MSNQNLIPNRERFTPDQPTKLNLDAASVKKSFKIIHLS